MATELHAQLEELNAIRLTHDWTWAELSESMRAANCQVSPRTLHYLIKRAGADVHALDRTVHKINTYVSRMKGNAALAKRGRAHVAAKQSIHKLNGRGA